MADVAEGAADTVKKGSGVLTKKVASVPIWVWGAAIVVGLIIAYSVKSKSGSISGENKLAVADDGSTGPESRVGDGSVGGFLYQQAQAAQAAKVYTTNEKWGQAAIQYLIGQGYEASLADIAIRRYIGGLDISVQQRPLINAAIQGIGPTPQQMGPISELPGTTPITPPGGGGTPNNPPTTPPRSGGGIFGLLFGIVDQLFPGLNFRARGLTVPVGDQTYGVDLGYGNDGGTVTVHGPAGDETTVTAPRPSLNPATTTPVANPTTRNYTVKDGDTLATIALAMYGSSLQASKIYNANLAIIADKDHLTPGITLVIPE